MFLTGITLIGLFGAVAPAASASTGASPMGTLGRIAFVQDNQIRTVRPDGSGYKTLTNSGKNYSPAWSPDGSLLAYVHESAAGTRDLWIMRSDGSAKVAATSTGGVSAGSPSWSPDGRRLAYGGACAATVAQPDMCEFYDGATVLDTIKTTAPFVPAKTLTGGADSPMTGPMTVLDGVSWSSDGDHIAFANDNFPNMGDMYMLVFGLSDRVVDVLAMIGYSGLEGTFANPAFNPDGNLLAYDSYVDAQGEIEHEGIELCDYPVTSCGLFKDVALDSHLAYARTDNRVVLARDVHGGKLVLADLDGTNRSPLRRGTQPAWQPVAAD